MKRRWQYASRIVFTIEADTPSEAAATFNKIKIITPANVKIATELHPIMVHEIEPRAMLKTVSVPKHIESLTNVQMRILILCSEVRDVYDVRVMVNDQLHLSMDLNHIIDSIMYLVKKGWLEIVK